MDAGDLAVPLLVGVLCGLVPLTLGYRREQLALGIVGCVACVAGGLLFGLFLAGPLAFVFTLLIARTAAPERDTEAKEEGA